MDVRFRFPLSRPVKVEDSWPLSGFGATLELKREGDTVSAITVTFENQPITAAPRASRPAGGPFSLEIKSDDMLETHAKRIVGRLSDYVGLYYSLDVDFDDVYVEYIPANDDEKAQIAIFNARRFSPKPLSVIDFPTISQAFFAGESQDDPSYVSSLNKMARDTLTSKRYIESFRYSFLLFESVYGDGKFKTAELERAFINNSDFLSIIAAEISEIKLESRRGIDRDTLKFLSEIGDERAIIKYLISKRGFYFHGNLKRKDSWHPQDQDSAKTLATFCAQLTLRVCESFGRAMFAPEIGQKHMNNAVRHSAIVTINVVVNYLDANLIQRSQKFDIRAPGNIPTNNMAIEVQALAISKFREVFPVYDLISVSGTASGGSAKIFDSTFVSSSTSKATATSSTDVAPLRPD